MNRVSEEKELDDLRVGPSRLDENDMLVRKRPEKTNVVLTVRETSGMAFEGDFDEIRSEFPRESAAKWNGGRSADNFDGHQQSNE